MEDDEFMKELNEATDFLKQNEKTTNSSNKLEQSNSTNIPNLNPNESDPLKMLLNMFNIKEGDMNFNENDPDFLAMSKEINESMSNMKSSTDDIFKNLFNNNIQNSSQPASNINTNQSDQSNPFLSALDDDNFQMKDIGDIFSKLTNLAEFSENDKKEEIGEDTINRIIEDLIEMLLKNNLLKESLTELKQTVEKSLNDGNIDDKKKENYSLMKENINIILNETEKTNPDKKLIVNLFVKLNEMTDLDDKIFSSLTPELANLFSMADLK